MIFDQSSMMIDQSSAINYDLSSVIVYIHCGFYVIWRHPVRPIQDAVLWLLFWCKCHNYTQYKVVKDRHLFDNNKTSTMSHVIVLHKHKYTQRDVLVFRFIYCINLMYIQYTKVCFVYYILVLLYVLHA